jgi:hypothetical protein
LLGKDLETNIEARAAAMQRRGKHASTTIELLVETVFSTRSVLRIIRRIIGATQLSVESQSVKRRLGGWCEMATSLGVTCKNFQLEWNRLSERT